jgi:hypothetical protein
MMSPHARSARRCAAGILCVLVFALPAGCGGAKKPATAATHAAKRPPTVCLPGARAVVARRVRAAVTSRQSTGNNAMPQCVYRAGGAAVTANVDSAPQAYTRLERTVVEETQQFSVKRGIAPAQRIAHMGLDADWFPEPNQLLTTDGRRLLTVTVDWPHNSQPRKKALAKDVARAYLRTKAPQGG